jgi:hypothetical protein
MAHESITIALGIPRPSTDPVFLAIVGIHLLFGLTAVISGAVAMLSRKGRGRHARYGTLYFWSLCGVFGTLSALSLLRWAENYPLFIIGVVAFASAYFGRTAARRRWRQWPRLHLVGMGASYIALLTGFYVDNGKNLPLWRALPPIAYWLLPGAIGVQLILYALYRHPFIQAFDRSQSAPSSSSD